MGRFWTTDVGRDSAADVLYWAALVDEEAGGIVAYFADEDSANLFAMFLNRFATQEEDEDEEDLDA